MQVFVQRFILALGRVMRHRKINYPLSPIEDHHPWLNGQWLRNPLTLTLGSLSALSLCVLCGCASNNKVAFYSSGNQEAFANQTGSPERDDPEGQTAPWNNEPLVSPANYESDNLHVAGDLPVRPTAFQQEPLEAQDQIQPGGPDGTEPDLENIEVPTIGLDSVVRSVHGTFPLLEAAFLESVVADGKQIAAWGEFDTKLKAQTENGPTSFYETYRNSVGLVSPVYGGGQIYGGYRIGRGTYQPWYLERETNDGGEFKAGFRVPLLRDRDIDERRAELWRATYEQQRVQPEIRSQLIMFVRDASILYWSWIAAGKSYQIGERALQLSVERNSRLDRAVKEGLLDPPVLQDNLRSIALRESKLIDRERKLREAAVKLSLFYRDMAGTPLVPDATQLADFPEPLAYDELRLESDIDTALNQRPELAAINAYREQLRVDLAEAENEFLPALDAMLAGSQDVGTPTSSKRDKSRFEVEAGLFLDVPLQRRKAIGKTQIAEANIAQLNAKQDFTENKIVAEVQSAYVGLTAAFARLERAREAKRLAEYMADTERRSFDLGGSDLLAVFLRERSAIEAADEEVFALLEYFIARAEYDAALAYDWPSDPSGESIDR